MASPAWRDRLWHDWVVACIAGEVLGIGVAAAAAGLAITVVGEPTEAAERWGVFALLVGAGALEGLALGGMQWRVLRQPLAAVSGRAWIGATVAVAALGWAAGMLPSTLMAPEPAASAPLWDPGLGAIAGMAALGGAAAGAVFGGAQWLALRRHVENAGRWIGANVVGWTLAMVWITVGASVLPEGTPTAAVVATGIVAGLLSGLTVGAVTGVALLRLADAPPTA